jgi:transposase
MDRLGNHVHHKIQTLFPNNGAVFQDDNILLHTAGTVQTWFEEREGELQHLPWPTPSPDLNNIEPLWSVLETRMKNRFPPPTPRKQLEDVLQEEWCKIPLETVQNLYGFIPRRIAGILKAVHHHIVTCILVMRQVVMGSGFDKAIYLDFHQAELQLFVT